MSSQTTSSAAVASPADAPATRPRRSVYRPLVALVSAGVALRVLAMVLYWPAVMTSYDEPRFARAGPTGLFDDFWMRGLRLRERKAALRAADATS